MFPVEFSLGARHHIHDSHSEYEAHSIPVTVEIVDGPERINALLAEFRGAFADGLVTIEPVRVVHYRDHAGST